MRKRLLSLFLALCMMSTMLPSTAFAAGIGAAINGESGKADSENPPVYENHTQHDESSGHIEAKENTALPDDDVIPPDNEVTTPDDDVIPPDNDVTTPDNDVITPDSNEPGQEDCICEERCREDAINMDCPVCSADGADLSEVCKGEPADVEVPNGNGDVIITAFSLDDANGDGYNDNDEAFINNLIADHSLNAQPDNPGSWGSIVNWNAETPRRIYRLNLNGQGLTGNVNFCGLSALQSIYCEDNSLTGIDVSGLTNLIILDCNNNPLELLKLSDTQQMTVHNAPVGQVSCIASNLNSRYIELSAVPREGYVFSRWIAENKTGFSEDALKKADIMLFINEIFSMTPVYTSQALIPLVAAVEGSSYTLPQTKAETATMLKESLAEQINGLTELQAAGITITAADIDVTSFASAVGGTEDNPNGTAGSFAFTVTITKDGDSSAAQASGSITATKIPGAVAIGETEYPTLEAAFREVKDGETVILRKDINNTTSTRLNGASKTVTLDLCGHTVSCSDTVIELGSGNHLTITDSSAAKSGLIRSTNYNAISANGGNTLTIEGGTLCAAGDSRYAIDVWGSDVNLIVNGGTVEATAQNGYAIYATQPVTITINGGIVGAAGDNGYAIYAPHAATTITVGGGLILGDCAVPQGQRNPQWSVAGSSTLETDAAIPEGKTLTVQKNAALTILENTTLTNNGVFRLTGNGRVTGGGRLAGNGVFQTVVSDLSENDIQAIDDQPYTGRAIEPDVAFHNRSFLGKGFAVDASNYDKSYENNIEAGSAKVIFTEKGNSGNKAEKSFVIVKSGTVFDGGVKTCNGQTETDSFTYGDIITVTAKPRPQAAGVQFRSRSLPPPAAAQMALFTGATQISQAVNADADGVYTMEYATDGKDLSIGINTITAKYVGDDNMADFSQDVNVTLNQKTVAAAVDSSDPSSKKVYDGNPLFHNVALTLTGVESGDSVTARADGRAANPNAGENKAFSITSAALNGKDAGYYKLAGDLAAAGYVTITLAAITPVPTATRSFINVVGGSGEVNLASELEKYGPTGYTLGTVKDENHILSGVPTVTADGKLAFNVADTGEVGDQAAISVTVTFQNYSSITFVTTVELTAQTPIEIKAAVSDADYTGKPYAELKNISADGYNGQFIITYEENETASADAPANAGSYTVTITPADRAFVGEWSGSFTIHKVSAIVKVEDASMAAGSPKPEYTLELTGFVNGETISDVSFDDSAVDTAATGRYEVVPAGGTVSGGGADNYNITYGKGYLTVTVDTAALADAIDAARAVQNGIVVSDQFVSQVETGTKFVSTAAMEALKTAIAAAEIAEGNAETVREVTEAAAALNNAVTAFQTAIKTGTYVPGSSSSGDSDDHDDHNQNGNRIPVTPSLSVGSTDKGEIQVPTTVDKNGKESVTITDENVRDAIDQALTEASKNGTQANGVTVMIHVTAGSQEVSSVTVNLTKEMQEKVIAEKVVNIVVVIDSLEITITLDLDAIKNIHAQAGSDVRISVMKISEPNLPSEAKVAIGNRPAFDFKVNYDDNKTIHSFGAGSVNVTIPYTLQKGELAGNVQAVYVDENGKVTYLTNSSYDSTNKVLRFSTDHFSTYGVGYRVTPTFSDINGHWAENDILFVVNRGLLNGTSATVFAPDSGMTRGMFVTALGRLTDIDPAQYKDTRFTDVEATAYYAPYVAWAADKGIVVGTTDTTFAPDGNISREQMAVVMQKYAKTMGYTVPRTCEAVTFTDHGAIAGWAKDAVQTMQMAGVLHGRDGNCFDPQGTATRAEVAAMLHRYVELVIDPATAQGWK